jgi:hypothetical protein
VDFDQIADEQDWDTDSMLHVMRGFIAECGNEMALAEYAERIAAQENQEAGL